MTVRMRILQRYDIRHEREFMELEREFEKLERRRPDYPEGRRMTPLSGSEPCNTLIWECDFPDIQSARAALDFFHGDAEHEALFEKQSPFIESVRIEFFHILDDA